MYGGFGSVF
jgi:hypothetical protein